MVNLSADFTGDGWPDILSSLGNRHMDLYVNPKGESRRWDKFSVLPTITSEIVLLRGPRQGRQARGGVRTGRRRRLRLGEARPVQPDGGLDGAHASRAPASRSTATASASATSTATGALDIVVPTGWYEQPAGGIRREPVGLPRSGARRPTMFGSGGGEMGVYDVNGDGLTDVVAGSAHNWGLNWFEQKKGAGRQHLRPAMPSPGTSRPRTPATSCSPSRTPRGSSDMDGDKIPDMITGKRYWSEGGNNSMTDTDPTGAPVLYIYKTVRDPKAPGGARFVPELVHNKSGVGSSFDVVDLNKDGRPDIAVATTFGTYVFYGRPSGR